MESHKWEEVLSKANSLKEELKDEEILVHYNILNEGITTHSCRVAMVNPRFSLGIEPTTVEYIVVLQNGEKTFTYPIEYEKLKDFLAKRNITET